MQNPAEEGERIRTEIRELRQRNASIQRARDSFRDKSVTLESQNKQKDETIKQLEEKNKTLEENVKELEGLLAGVILYKDRLIGMLFKTSKKKETALVTGNGALRRTLGGQKGHTGHGRKKPMEIDEEKTIYLSHCPDCQLPLSRSRTTHERIVEDIVVPAVTKVTRYFIERQWCSHCEKERCGIPANVLPGFRLGTKTLQLILFLKYRLRLPFEKIHESLSIQYGLDVTAGALAHILQRMGDELTPQYHAIIAEMRDSPVKHADETSWPMNGTKGWCWAFMSPTAVAYTIEETRGKGVTDIMLGKTPTGVLVRDDFAAYYHLDMEQQSCWAHLMRNSHDAVKQETASDEMKALHKELAGMYEKLSAIVATPFDEQKRAKHYVHYLKQITVITKRHYRAVDVKKIQTRMSNQLGNLITALKYENVPLTNNHAERQVRPMAVIRKISGGSRSATGAMATAINMSVIQTIALKGQNMFGKLGELLTPVNQRFSLEGTE